MTILWFIGHSGAGKTTLAEKLRDHLDLSGIDCEFLDGDLMRQKTRNFGFTHQERFLHLKSMGEIARDKATRKLVIAAFITPYEDIRKVLRQNCPGYIEIWIDTSLEECERRDVKGLYAKARRGEIPSFTGISDVFEKPVNADIRIVTEKRTVDESFNELLNELKKKNIL